jgi:ubiquinone/menaquinone biosynthesis C-methylase UbiE
MDQKEAWNTVYRQHGRTWRGVLDAVFPFSTGDSVLDLGCGSGKSSAALIASGYRVTGADISDEAAERCLSDNPGMRCVCSSATSLPFGDGEFDGVAMIHLLEHLDTEETTETSAEVSRILRPGGIVFVRSFSKGDMRSPGNGTEVKGNGIRYRYFSEADLKDIFSMMTPLSLTTTIRRTKFGGTRSWIDCVFRRT